VPGLGLRLEVWLAQNPFTGELIGLDASADKDPRRE
jgi:hypothetical protein